jgi:hypothetical protein
MATINTFQADAVKSKTLQFTNTKKKFDVKQAHNYYQPQQVKLEDTADSVLKKFESTFDEIVLATNDKEDGKVVKHDVTQYVDKLSAADLITLTTYLCYTNDGLKVSGLKHLLFHKLNNDKTYSRVRKYKVIIELCDQLAAKITNYRITRIRNPLFRNQEGIEENFIKELNQAKGMAKNLLYSFHTLASVRYTARKITQDLAPENWTGGGLTKENTLALIQDLKGIDKFAKYMSTKKYIPAALKAKLEQIKTKTKEVQAILANPDQYIEPIIMNPQNGSGNVKQLVKVIEGVRAHITNLKEIKPTLQQILHSQVKQDTDKDQTQRTQEADSAENAAEAMKNARDEIEKIISNKPIPQVADALNSLNKLIETSSAKQGAEIAEALNRQVENFVANLAGIEIIFKNQLLMTIITEGMSEVSQQLDEISVSAQDIEATAHTSGESSAATTTTADPITADQKELRLIMIHKELNQVAKQIENFHRITQGGGTLDPAANLANGVTMPIAFTGSILPTVLYNTFAESPTATAELGNALPDPAEPLPIFAALEALAGFSLAISRRGEIELSQVVKQSIGLYKNYLLTLISNYYQLGGQLTQEEEAYYRKFLAIKRGNFVENLVTSAFNLRTNSIANLDTILARRSTSQEANNLAMDMRKDFVSFVNLKASLQSLVCDKDYAQLKSTLTTLIPSDKDSSDEAVRKKAKIAKKLAIITFEDGNLRGNLLTHLINANVNNPNNKVIQDCLNLIISSKNDDSTTFEKFKKAKDSDFYTLYHYLFDSYKITNKYTFLIDLQYMLLGITMNEKLTSSQKAELIDKLEKELRNSNGKFSAIRVRRTNLFYDATLSALLFQGFNIKPIATATYLHATDSIGDPKLQDLLNNMDSQLIQGYFALAEASGAAGWAAFSTLWPLREHYMNWRNTTTSSSALQMVKDIRQSKYIKDIKKKQAQNPKPERPNSELEATVEKSLDNFKCWEKEPIAISEYTKIGSIRELQNKIMEEVEEAESIDALEALAIFSYKSEDQSKLTRDEYLAYYMALNQSHNGDILLNKVLQKAEILISKSGNGQNEEKYFKLISSVMQLWGSAVATVVKLETAAPEAIQTKPEDCSVEEFKKYVVLPNDCASADDALRHLFKCLGLIHTDPDKSRIPAKLEYLAGIIHRASIDSSSKWQVLRKRSKNKILMLKLLVRAVGAIQWAAASTAIISLGVKPYIGLPVLVFSAALRGLFYAAADNFTYTNTKQYKDANQFLNTEASIRDPKQIKEKWAEQKVLIHKKLDEILTKANPHKEFENNLMPEDKLVEFYIERLNNYLQPKILAAQTDKLSEQQEPTKGETTTLPACEAKDLPQLIIVVNEILAAVSDATDKYLASQSLLRIVTIITQSRLHTRDKLAILFQITHLFETRALNISVELSQNRSFFTKRKYFIPDVIGCILFGSGNYVGIPDFGIDYLAQVAAAASGDLVATLYLTYWADPSETANTTSYQKGMKFLKAANYFLLKKLREEGKASPEFEKEVERILKTHTGSLLTRWGKTASEKKYFSLSSLGADSTSSPRQSPRLVDEAGNENEEPTLSLAPLA